jgi:hypothetical protein
MDIFDAYEMDDDAITNGVWGDLIVRGEKIGRIRCRSSDADINTEYRKGLNLAGLALAAMQEKGTKGEELEKAKDELTAGLLADTILTDWELYQKRGDKEVKIKFSPQKARELILKLPKLRAAVEACASGWTRFRKGQIKETLKI